MSMAQCLSLRTVFLFILAVHVSGCATGMADVTAADVPRLQQAAAASPDDLDLRTQFGIALYKAERFNDARTALGTVVDDGGETGAAFFYLGLANEALEDWGGAREAYSRYLDVGKWDPLKNELRERLLLMVRRELQTAARTALAQEAQLTTAAPRPRTVAVFPFRLISDNQDLLPLRVAMADMMITDLSLSNALTVLERTQIQSLLDEMALTETGYTSAVTGARAGRMLRAEHVVQGALTTLGTDALRMDADVLNTVRAQSAGSVQSEDLLEALFDMEKDVVFQVLDVLGAELTPAEREAINANRAENLLAFLAYGRGLMAMDRGDYQDAQNFFQQAAALDPGYAPAVEAEAEAESLASASTTTAGQVENTGAAELGGGLTGVPGANDLLASNQSLLTKTANDVNPSPAVGVLDQGTTGASGQKQTDDRDPIQEAAGSEGTTMATTSTAVLRIFIPRPPKGGGLQ
ncbi:MAG: tetratricopeptide repeat protein [Gemmatimonadetes bacterium]|nr:tetratricopeptide repeat protein [Gemmatimonadota bacterium]